MTSASRADELQSRVDASGDAQATYKVAATAALAGTAANFGAHISRAGRPRDDCRRTRRRLDHGQGGAVGGRRRSAGRTTSGTTRSRPRWCSSSSARMEDECGLRPGRDRIFFTGSGAGLIAPLVGGKTGAGSGRRGGGGREAPPRRQLRLRDRRRGHEDALLHAERRRQEQTGLHAVGLQRRHRHVHREDRAQAADRARAARPRELRRPHAAQDQLEVRHLRRGRRQHAGEVGRAGRRDHRQPLRGGDLSEPRDAHEGQHAAARACCCSAGPTSSFAGLQEAWRHHLGKLWAERKIDADPDRRRRSVPEEAVYYACLGCIEIARGEAADGRRLCRHATSCAGGSRRASGRRRRGKAPRGWSTTQTSSTRSVADVRATERRSVSRTGARPSDGRCSSAATSAARPPRPWCCRASASCCSAVTRCRTAIPIEDAKALFRQLREAGFAAIAALALTGYGKDLLKDVIGADLGIVETVAHATAALHYFPDADVICDVGGCDVKIMILRQGTVADFRLNSQCSSGNGAFLQGVAERYAVPLEEYAGQAFRPTACRRWRWAAASSCSPTSSTSSARAGRRTRSWPALAAVLPLNVWVYAGQLQNLAAAGRKFVLQGGTHRNLAVVKAQVDFIRAQGARCRDRRASVLGRGRRDRRGALRGRRADDRQREPVPRLRGHRGARIHRRPPTSTRPAAGARSTASARSSTCGCRTARAGRGARCRSATGWERVISGNSCPKGLVEDVERDAAGEDAAWRRSSDAHPNTAEMVRADAFRAHASA